MSTNKVEEFKLPIFSCKNLQENDESLVSELELIKSKTNIEPVYKTLMNPKTPQGIKIMNEYSKYYKRSLSYFK